MKNNRGKLLFCIWIFCTFASSMKIKICAPREKFFSPTGEIKKFFELARMTFGFDKEDGRRKWPHVRPEPLVLTMKNI